MSRRDDIPPCERCGTPRGAHTYACPVPAIRRAAKAFASLARVDLAVLADALRTVRLDALVQVSVLVGGEITSRQDAARAIGVE